ncbi:hypothetical protein ACFW15_28345, partial [Streptomyces sp. NPDC058953]
MRALTRGGPAAGALAALALALVLTGCGSDGGEKKVASAPSAKGAAGGSEGGGSSGGDGKDGASGMDNKEKARKFAECLRKQGLDVSDPDDGKFTMKGNGLPKEK